MRPHAPGRLRLRTSHTLTRALLTFFLIATLGLTTAWLPAPVGAAGIVVDTLADTIDATQEPSCGGIDIADLPGDGDGKISLREAICAANNTDGDDVITFQAGLVGPIALSDGQLVIGSTLTITGLGKDVLAIVADGESRVFAIESGTVAMSGLTIRGGEANGDGGGILNFGDLTLTDVDVLDNVAVAQSSTYGGGIHNGGTLMIVRTNVSGNDATYGGGIYNGGTLIVTDSAIDENMAEEGGGILSGFFKRLAETGVAVAAINPTATLTRTTVNMNEAGYQGGGIAIASGDATLIDSTVAGNTTNYRAGGIANEGALILTDSTISGNSASGDAGPGGGIYNGSGATLVATNSTISGNSIDGNGGGIYNSGSGEVTLRFVTITGNRVVSEDTPTGQGGGIFQQFLESSAIPAEIGETTVSNSIVAGNSSGDDEDCSGAVVSGGHNVFGADTGCAPTGTGDITTGNVAAVLNSTLADNGGPTRTHALVAGSAAQDAGDDAACADAAIANSKDQRGTARPQGARCDIGAYERVVVTLVTLTVQTEGSGTVAVSPAPTSSGGTPTNTTYQYATGTVVTLTATPASGQVFARWTIDGVGELPYGKGWASPLTITLDTAHTAKATFAARPSFTDVPASHPSYTAITELTARGIIKGYTAAGCEDLNTAVPCFGPDDQTQRAQSAAFLARLLGFSNENHGTGGFTDLAGLDPELQRAVGTMAHYDIMIGYGDGRFGPNDKITYLQTALVISRAFVVKGHWTEAAADDPSVYPNLALSAGERLDLVTFVQNVGPLPGFVNNTQRAALDQPAPRSWTAEALWLALDGHYGVDEPGKGGFVP